MRTPLRRLGRHHTVVAAYLALFAALGGTAYAANVVTSDDIQDETIQAQDIGPGAVTNEELGDESVTQNKLHYSSVDGSKVINGSLSGPDVANGSLSGADVADGSIKGADLDLVTVEAETGGDPAMVKTATATCPAGRKVVGGGGEIRPKSGDAGSHPQNLVALARSAPVGTSGWAARGEVIRHPATLDFTLKEDEDGYVTGIATYLKRDFLTYQDEGDTWVVHAWAICV